MNDYIGAIGIYALPIFLRRFGMNTEDPELAVSVSVVSSMHKRIASGAGLATLYTFEISPYKILPMALVYRRDDLPHLSPEPEDEYQRPLIAKKIESIRRDLLGDPDFMFPNAILAVISSDCTYNAVTRTLFIPKKNGSMSVIDGQHRLFSYASPDIERSVGTTARIIITAIQFENATEGDIRRYSASAFVQINTTQTTVPSAHLDAIAYPVLGQIHPKALAAQVVLQVNESQPNKKLRGLFNTSQTSLGLIRVTTVVAELASVTNLDTVNGLTNPRSPTQQALQRGYTQLLESSITDLQDPNQLIAKSATCLERYFSNVASVFRYDFPVWNSGKGWKKTGSSIEYTKVFAAFVRLLVQFIREGLSWEQVRIELENIRNNVLQLRGLQSYSAVLLDHTAASNIPDDGPSVAQDYAFLVGNRTTPTSV